VYLHPVFSLKVNMSSGCPGPDECPPYASFFGAMGATSAMIFSGMYIRGSNVTRNTCVESWAVTFDKLSYIID